MPLKSTNRMQAWWALTKPYPGNAARFRHYVVECIGRGELAMHCQLGRAACARLAAWSKSAEVPRDPGVHPLPQGAHRRHDVRDGLTKYFDLTEFATWSEKDSHSLAYQVLKNERSRKMGQLLGIKPESDSSCLGCHAVNVDASQCAEAEMRSRSRRRMSVAGKPATGRRRTGLTTIGIPTSGAIS